MRKVFFSVWVVRHRHRLYSAQGKVERRLEEPGQVGVPVCGSRVRTR